MFFEENAKLLEAFAKVSGIAGARADYVQGGGGNTSVKLGGGLMAIKASGFCLSDINRKDSSSYDLGYICRGIQSKSKSSLNNRRDIKSHCGKDNKMYKQQLNYHRCSTEYCHIYIHYA